LNELVHLRGFALLGSARDALGKELLRKHRFRKRCARTVTRFLGLRTHVPLKHRQAATGGRCPLFGRG
jgi:hypothetical protein